MLVLHLLWDDFDNGRLLLWIERPPRERSSTSYTHADQSRPQGHPGARGHEALINAIRIWLSEATANRSSRTYIDLILPTSNNSPQASPELRTAMEGEDTPDAKNILWQPWRIAALSLPNPGQILRRLSKVTLPEEVVLGASARYWIEASQLVNRLIARHCYAPYAGDDDFTLLARWSPVYDAQASHELRAVAAAMPGMCRALILPGLSEENHHVPDALPILSSFVERVLDRRVRRKLRNVLQEKLSGDERGLAAKWLRRLAGPFSNAFMFVRTPELHAFSETLRSWLAAFHVLPEARGRLCVQLDEPAQPTDDNPEPGWRLSYFLQDVDEPSVLVPARQIWHHEGRDAAIAQRRFIRADRTLLADLSKAGPLCAPIAETLKQPMPESATLTVEQAHTFLRSEATALEQGEIGVRLPVWWQKQPKLTLQLKMSDQRAFFGVETLVKFNWQAALGDLILSRAEFETLSRLKAPLAQVRGHWVEVNADSLRRTLHYFEKRKAGLTLTETLRAASEGGENEIGLKVSNVDAKGQLRELLERLRGGRKLSAVETPKTFSGELRPYQERGLAWLAFLSEYGLGACLADDMGLGKTVQLLALLEYWRAHDTKPGPVLLVCPMSVVGNWQREAARFAPKLSVLMHHGVERLDGQDFRRAVKKHDLILTTYALAHRDQETLREIKWRAVVLDEAQNIKTHDAKQTRAIRSIPTKQRIALTGTPVENRLSELWSILDFLNPGSLGNLESFQHNYSRRIEHGDDERAAQLRKLVQPFILRRLKSDKTILSDLPDKTEHVVYCNLTREQATLYKAVTKDMLERIAEATTNFERGRLIVKALMRLKQICNHPAHYLHDSSRLAGRSGKLARIEAMLEEALSAGDKALIFSQYTAMAGPLQKYLQQRFKREVLYLHGGTTQKKRDELVWRFQEEPKGPPIFVLSLKAGGTGLNLTAANHVFHYDRWWNPAVENQATDRAYRIGQKRDVQVHKLVCVGTLEERIDQLLKKKSALADSVVGNGEAWLNEFSTEQLRDLFTLGADAVEEG